jgi:hypothetical protein
MIVPAIVTHPTTIATSGAQDSCSRFASESTPLLRALSACTNAGSSAIVRCYAYASQSPAVTRGEPARSCSTAICCPGKDARRWRALSKERLVSPRAARASTRCKDLTPVDAVAVLITDSLTRRINGYRSYYRKARPTRRGAFKQPWSPMASSPKVAIRRLGVAPAAEPELRLRLGEIETRGTSAASCRARVRCSVSAVNDWTSTWHRTRIGRFSRLATASNYSESRSWN